MRGVVVALLGVVLLCAGGIVPLVPSDDKKLVAQLRFSGLDSRETSRGVLIVLPDAFFEFGKHALTLEARSRLQDALLTLNGPIAEDRRIAIEGHTDSIGPQIYNLALSFKRSRTVEQELLFSNVSDERMSVGGFGEARPLAPNAKPNGSDNPDGRAKNRRVEIIILHPDAT